MDPLEILRMAERSRAYSPELAGIGVRAKPTEEEMILQAMRSMEERNYMKYLMENSDGNRSSASEAIRGSELEQRAVNPEDLFPRGEMPDFSMYQAERSKSDRELRARQAELSERRKEINL